MTEVLIIFAFLFFYTGLLKVSLGSLGRGALIEARSVVTAIIIFLPFYIVTAFRDFSTGVDTLSYYYEYLSCSDDCYIRGSEPFFSLINQFFNYVGVDFRGFLVVQSIFYYIAFSALFIRSSVQGLFVCLIYSLFLVVFGVFGFGISGIRQSIAMSLFLLSIPFFVNRNYFIYCFFGFLSFYVHNSAIVPFVVVLFTSVRFRISPRSLLVLVVASPIALLIGQDFFRFLAVVDFKQSNYLTGESLDTINFKVPIMYYCVAVLIALLVNFVPSRLMAENIRDRVSEDRFVLLCASSVVFVSYLLWLAMSIRLLERIALYFMPLAGVFLVMVFSDIRNVMWVVIVKLAVFFVLISLSVYVGGIYFANFINLYF